MKEEELTCEDCGVQNETVKDGVCPYAQDIHYKDVECTLCPHCYHERCMDI
jgi:hypothetical protein